MTSTITTTETLQEAVPFVAPPSPPEDTSNKELPEKPYYDVEFNYRLDPRDGGDEVIWGGTVGLMRRKYETRTVRINNERGNEHNFNLDTHGFAWVKHKTSVTEFADYLAIRQGPYYGEVAEMLKRVTGATKVHVIGHLHRSLNYNDTTEEEKNAPDMTMTKGQTPGRFVHVDQSYQGAVRRLYLDLPQEEARRLEKTRWAIINVWRPVRKVTNEPLAVCDARSVREDELFNTLHLVPMRWPDAAPQENQMWAVAPPKTPTQHKWHYVSGMTEHEALLIKMFDSKKDGTARRVPHSSFPTPDDFGEPRASTETRCFVFWEDQEAE
ncbi:hypothetical protein CKM354_000353100 [Cercospora kikuchii]|uniref:GA4 desaturase family protein n=1 Tax=Cercospora kikuchii TaxID=84275 RepID=A0A9P3C9P7_9PEZI|nr:uncharacterized protein CKM354_000353100 [Cercospora kikuchii]GIZ40179.1 hypothetical protein CKM354_000353100 [Cercospora kikuchii]